MENGEIACGNPHNYFIKFIEPLGGNMNEEDKNNRQLLYTAVYQMYIAAGVNSTDADNATEEMIFKHIDNLFGFQGFAYQIGEISFPFFCKYFLQDTFIPKEDNAARELAPVHLEVWSELEDMFLRDLSDKVELVLPRGCAKTTVCDFALSVWLHCYKKSTYTIVAGRTEFDATEYISQTKKAFEENKYILDTFGKLIDSRKFIVNRLELELSNNTKIEATSSTSSMRGKKYNGNRPSVIIADDYQGKGDIITQEARDKKYNTWVEDSGYAGDKAVYRKGKKIKQATKFIVLGTILHRDCFMSRLLLNKDYKHILKRAVDFDVDDFFRNGLWEEFRLIYFNDKLQDSVSVAKEFYYQCETEMQYKTIWEDKFDCLDLAIDYYTNPQAFKQEMMNDASKIGEKWFKSMRTQPAKEIETHTFEKTILVCDPASSVSIKSDYSAFCVGSIATNGFAYVRKGIIERLGFDDLCAKVIELLKIYTEITHVSIEKNLYMGADVSKIKELILKEPELRNRTLDFLNKMQHANKDDRIATIIQGVDTGQIIFNEEDTDAINQILDFSGQGFCEHDDFADCVSQFMIDIKEIKFISSVSFFDRKLLGI